MSRERRRTQQTHQDAGGHEDTDLDPPHRADRQTETNDLRHLDPPRSEGVAQHPQCPEARHDADAKHQTYEHQPVVDGARIARASHAEGRRSEMAEDQRPVQRRVAGDADEEHRHDRPSVRQRGEEAAQHCKAEKSRRTPGNRPQIAADLGGERGIVAERPEQQIQTRQRDDKGQRQQHGEHQPGAGDPTRSSAIAGAECVRGERRHGGKDSLKRDAAGEIKHPAEPRGGERHGAEPPDHHRVGHRHRHLGEISCGQRSSERKRRPPFQPHPSNRLHLVLFHLRHGAADAGGLSEKERPRPVPAGPRIVACRLCSVHAHTLRPYGNAARVGGLDEVWECANHGPFVDEEHAAVNGPRHALYFGLGAGALGNQAIVLDPAVLLEIEDRAPDVVAEIEVERCGDDLVVLA